MIFYALYDLALHLYALFSLPKIALQFQKYKKNLTQRFGVRFPHIEKKDKQLIWVHAVSLGETKAVIPLIKKIKSLTNPPLVLLSTTTTTGHIEGCTNAPFADFHVFLPVDLSYVIRPIVKRIAPDVIVITETDFWFHFQDAAKKIGAQVVLINGKISERSFKNLSKFPFFAKRLFGAIDHFYLQGDGYKSRFTKLKIPSHKLTVTGNLKLDGEIETCDVLAFKKRMGLSSQKILTLGSTHDPEEKIWIKSIKHLWQRFPDVQVLLVPRHPERFDEVARLLELENIAYSRFSKGEMLQKKSILLVDTMGLLKKCYQVCDLAFVGGSLTSKIGGHNILEPIFYGKPVLFGPHMHAQPDLFDLVTTFKAGIQITEETLLPTLQKLFTDLSICHKLGENGKKLITSSQGALDRTFEQLLPLLQKQAPC